MTERPAVDGLMTAASRALSGAWEADVALRLQDPIRDAWGRHTLLLGNVVDGPPSAPRTVVIKAAVEANGAVFTEWSVLEWLNSIDPMASLVPKFYAGDMSAHLMVLEDLGTGPLLRRMLHTRSAWALDALIESQRMLGAVHAATRGRHHELDAVRRALPGGPPPPAFQLAPALLEAEMSASGVVPSAAAIAELAEVCDTMNAAPGFAALTFHDACPPNRILTPTGVRPLDFEMAAFRHPMIDAAYGVVGHLRCMDGLTMPKSVRRTLTEAYRDSVEGAYPEYRDDVRFHRDLTAAGAIWMFELLRAITAKADADRRVGFYGITARQRVIATLGAFVALATTTGALPGIAAWAEELEPSLISAWGAVPELPVFPAFAD